MNEELKQKFEKVIIPSIENMIEKEKLHIDSLKYYQKRYGNNLSPDINDFIKKARLNLKHLKFRLKQYKEFI